MTPTLKELNNKKYEIVIHGYVNNQPIITCSKRII